MEVHAASILNRLRLKRRHQKSFPSSLHATSASAAEILRPNDGVQRPRTTRRKLCSAEGYRQVSTTGSHSSSSRMSRTDFEFGFTRNRCSHNLRTGRSDSLSVYVIAHGGGNPR
jgi:hypothetical protein